MEFEIDVNTILVNQVLFPEKGSTCDFCAARHLMQKKYLDQMDALYNEDFHLVKIPLQKQEVRNAQNLETFSGLMLRSFEQEWKSK